MIYMFVCFSNIDKRLEVGAAQELFTIGACGLDPFKVERAVVMPRQRAEVEQAPKPGSTPDGR